jgi:NADPH-dependent curcumin reductase CurA
MRLPAAFVRVGQSRRHHEQPLTNHQVRLAKRPEGAATRENWKFTTEPVGEPAEGGVLVKTLSLSLDPAMRGWLNDARSYIPPVAIDEVMRAGGVGRVIASKNPGFAVGDTVYGTLGVQEYILVAQEDLKRNGLVKIDLSVGTIGQWLNVLGMPGMTGYFGLMDVGQPQPGETVVVSGAAGAVGRPWASWPSSRAAAWSALPAAQPSASGW